MTRFAELEDAEVDQLLRGDTPTGHEDLAPVAELAATMRVSAASRVPAMGTALRTQIQQRPHVPPRFAGLARRRLRLAAAAAAVAVVSIAAAQNALPAAAQRLVSNAADLVGIDVPHPDDDAGDDPAIEGEGTTPPSSGRGEGDEGPATPADPGEPGGGAVPADPGNGQGGNPGGGPPEETPGGAVPADPGAPGDGEPATPATPPPQPQSNRAGSGDGGVNGGSGGSGNAGGNGQGGGQSSGGGWANALGQVRDKG